MRRDEMRDEIVILLTPCKYNILNLLFHNETRLDEMRVEIVISTLLVNIIYYYIYYFMMRRDKTRQIKLIIS